MAVIQHRKVSMNEIAEDARLFCCLTYEELFSLNPGDMNDIYEYAAPRAFDRMRPKIKALDAVAQQNNISSISSFNDVVPLLFPHTMAKSYPLSFIEQGKFDRMNAWLDKLTAHDLSKLDVSECDSLNSWIKIIEENTPARVYCSSGTTGKMSFNNTSIDEDPYSVAGFLQEFEPFQNEYGVDIRKNSSMPLIAPYVKNGATGVAHRLQRLVTQLYNGDDSKVIALNGSVDADMLWLTGKLRGAESRGELGQLKLTPALERLRTDMKRDQNSMPERVGAFFERILSDFTTDPVLMFMPWPRYYELACYIRDQDSEFDLAPGSLIWSGGGLKGVQLEDGWRDVVRKYIPFEPMETYGMSEIPGGNARMCSARHYHMTPAVLPFVLDPKTSEPLPRKGKQTGRYAFLDLTATDHWGGIITGDEVTMDWDGGCSCGRVGPYIEGDPRRFGASLGDDKITCAKTPEAYDNAVDYLLGIG